jgi:hypothetical protein
MISRSVLALWVMSVSVSAMATGSARADEADVFGRALELPAHRALIARRDQPGTNLSQFKTDGCSGGLSEVWRLVADQFPGFADAYESAPPWESCCVTHDRAYHNGVNTSRAQASFAARLMADRTLEACVTDMGINRRDELAVVYDITPDQVETAYATIGGAMFWAVRFGGGPCTGLPWRWGFGYPNCSVLGFGSNEADE